MACGRIFKLEELRFSSQHCPLSTGSGPTFIKGSQPSALWTRGMRAQCPVDQGDAARCCVGQEHAGLGLCGTQSLGLLGWVSPGGDPGVGGACGLNEDSVVF